MGRCCWGGAQREVIRGVILGRLTKKVIMGRLVISKVIRMMIRDVMRQVICR